MASWSYALSRMRIFCAAIAATSLDFSRLSRASYRAQGAGPQLVGAPPRSYVLAVVSIARTGRWGAAGAAPIGSLLDDLGDDPRADGPATLADRETQALVHGDRLDQLDRH